MTRAEYRSLLIVATSSIALLVAMLQIPAPGL